MKTLFAFPLLVLLLSFSPTETLPEGWFKAGSAPDQYEMGLDAEVYMDGTGAAYIESKDKKTRGFGTLMQTCSAKEYHNTKIKMTGYIKAENVEGWAGMWLRVDAMDFEYPLGFDNMGDRPIKGTTDWVKCEIVLEVPENSSTLNFGALLSGTGKIWFDNITFEIVPTDTETTASEKQLERPTNTSFDE
jgi:hypothetical protein